MQPALLRKYEQPVPRYTSYPTAPHFTTDVGVDDYRRWLAAVDRSAPASLYVHVPFCDQLCWYCGCNTKATQRYEPVAEYLGFLLREIDAVADVIGGPLDVTHVHWGGGSPSILAAGDIVRLSDALRRRYSFVADAEVAVELDPRNVSLDKIKAFAAAGFNRISIGVQDFDERVQAAISREQSFRLTADVVQACRDEGMGSINIDLVYGLPHQTRDSIARTVDQVLTLAPDRIALFGYAHLPSRFANQRRIATESLPNAIERFAQSNRAAAHLTAAGYVRVGLDHFAKPADALAQPGVKRNFQGYTTDKATALIGFGASAIGRLEQGYVQNAVATAEYQRQVDVNGLAVGKGRALTDEDRSRGYVIERLLCDLRFDVADMTARFPVQAPVLSEIGQAIVESDVDGLVAARGEDGSFDVTERGRLFVRSICACFDDYLGSGKATHASGV